MSTLLVQDSLITNVEAAVKLQFPTIPVYYDNQPFDANNPPPVYIDVEVEFYASEPTGVGAQKSRHRGFLYVSVVMKEGTGSRTARQVHDWFIQRLAYQNIDPVQFEEPLPNGSTTSRGWKAYELKIPFFSRPL